MASITEYLRISGATEGLSYIQIKNLVRTSLAEMMNMTVEELTTRLNNRETVAPVTTIEEKKTDAETKEFLKEV